LRGRVSRSQKFKCSGLNPRVGFSRGSGFANVVSALQALDDLDRQQPGPALASLAPAQAIKLPPGCMDGTWVHGQRLRYEALEFLDLSVFLHRGGKIEKIALHAEKDVGAEVGDSEQASAVAGG